MSKQKAFIRYTKKGKIVPGSLIVTGSGGYPKDGTYKEVTPNLCCSGVTLRQDLSETTFPFTNGSIYIQFGCMVMAPADYLDIYVPGTPANIQELATILNERLSFLGQWDADGDELIFHPSANVIAEMCPPYYGNMVFFVYDGGI